MKRLFLVCCFIFTTSFSQDIVNKNGFQILPEVGDWSIGTDAGSFISFFGNIFSGDYNPIDLEFHNGTFLYGKKIKEKNIAQRFKIGAMFNSSTEDLEFGIGYGSERRKGSTRLQGFYGYEGFIGMNYINQDNIDDNKDFTTSIAASIFIGCEYFVASKIAIGAEYSYGPTLSISDQVDFLLEGGTGFIRMNFYF